MTKAHTVSPKGDPLLIGMVSAMVRVLPRGRGAFARQFGRLFFKYLQTCYVTTRYGAKLAVAPSSLDLIVTMINWGGSWEHWVYDTCKWIMPRDGVFFDIGANVGYMAIELLHEFPDARGVLFEPQPQLIGALNRSIELNRLHQRCQVLECALSDASGMARLNRFAHDGHASISRVGGAIGEIEVRTRTLDEVMERCTLPPPDVIKIDVEGHEGQMLKGGLHTLKAARPSLIFECSAKGQFDEIAALLRQAGHYRYFSAIGSYRPIRPILEEGEWQGKTDILAIEFSRRNELPSEFQPYFPT
jgi:FkbM family methyltransferase